MKNLLKGLSGLAVVVGFLVVLSGCGKGTDATTTAAQNGNCGTGYTFINNQCTYTGTGVGVGTGNCPAGYQFINNQCTYTGATNNTCAAGQVYTQYGCLTQAPCPQGYAFYPAANQCVQATQQQYPQGGGVQCPQGYMYSPQYNACYPYNSGGGVGGGFNFCFGFGC